MKRILFCILALWGFVCSIESKGENEESDLSIILKSLLIDTKKHYEKCDWDCVNIMDDNTMTGSYDILTAGDLLVSIVKTVSNDTIYGNLIVYEGNKFQLVKKHQLAVCKKGEGKFYAMDGLDYAHIRSILGSIGIYHDRKNSSCIKAYMKSQEPWVVDTIDCKVLNYIDDLTNVDSLCFCDNHKGENK